MSGGSERVLLLSEDTHWDLLGCPLRSSVDAPDVTHAWVCTQDREIRTETRAGDGVAGVR